MTSDDKSTVLGGRSARDYLAIGIPALLVLVAGFLVAFRFVEPPPPSRYGGPSIAYVWDDRVTFENDMTLTAGGEGQSGVEVLSTNLPWSVKVRWRGVEFDVQLFERTTSDFLVKPEDEPAEDQSGDL